MSSYFVDATEFEIPPVEQWVDLPLEQLLKIRVKLEDTHLYFRRVNPAYSKMVDARIAYIAQLILTNKR